MKYRLTTLFCVGLKLFLHNSFSALHLQSQNEGSLAQLVQSICLTSRGSGVRTPQLPHLKPDFRKEVGFFVFIQCRWNYYLPFS